jgi:CrcB protein
MTPATVGPRAPCGGGAQPEQPATGGLFAALDKSKDENLKFLIVFLGAGIGGALRHGVNLAASGLLGSQFPYGTLIINIVGSFLMGVIAEYFALKGHLPPAWRLFLTTGLLGGFTTFSTFSLDSALLYERGELLMAVIYAMGSVIFAIGGLFAGLFLIRNLVEV